MVCFMGHSVTVQLVELNHGVIDRSIGNMIDMLASIVGWLEHRTEDLRRAWVFIKGFCRRFVHHFTK